VRLLRSLAFLIVVNLFDFRRGRVIWPVFQIDLNNRRDHRRLRPRERPADEPHEREEQHVKSNCNPESFD